MEANENNVIESFKRAKADIVCLWDNVNTAKLKSTEVASRLERIELQQKAIMAQIDNMKPAKQAVVLNKTNMKLHAKNCFFAKNIKPKNRAVYSSAEELRGMRVDRCACMGA